MRHLSERSLATHFLFRCRGLHRRGTGWSGVSRCKHAIRYKAHRGVNAKKHEKRNPEITDDGLAHTRPVAEQPMVRPCVYVYTFQTSQVPSGNASRNQKSNK